MKERARPRCLRYKAEAHWRHFQLTDMISETFSSVCMDTKQEALTKIPRDFWTLVLRESKKPRGVDCEKIHSEEPRKKIVERERSYENVLERNRTGHIGRFLSS